MSDTFGLPPATPFEQTWVWDAELLEADSVDEVYVLRSAEAWTTLWESHNASADVPDVDFERFMVVGLRASGQPKAIYRVELDQVENATRLLVRVSLGSGLSQLPTWREHSGVSFHWVLTPRSDLVVRFVEDAMISGGEVGFMNRGVDERVLGEVDSGKQTLPKAKAALREQAEAAARATLSADEIAAARAQLMVGSLEPSRYPELWSVIDVQRKADAWRIVYDGVVMRVDVETGAVTREAAP